MYPVWSGEQSGSHGGRKASAFESLRAPLFFRIEDDLHTSITNFGFNITKSSQVIELLIFILATQD
jgi:hypothetical protein